MTFKGRVWIGTILLSIALWAMLIWAVSALL